MKDKRTYTNYKEHGEDISHENEIVIDFVEAKTDDTINKLRNNVRDLLMANNSLMRCLNSAINLSLSSICLVKSSSPRSSFIC